MRNPSGDSLKQDNQSDFQLKFREDALDRMVKTNYAATGQPQWELIRDVISLASGEDAKLRGYDASHYRSQYHDDCERRKKRERRQ